MPSILSPRIWLPAATLMVLVAATAAYVVIPLDSALAGTKELVPVPKTAIRFDDGDSVDIHWPGKAVEHIRVLGIDTPEVLHLDHEIPYAQAFGGEAAGFLRGCIAMADKVELLRSGNQDKYGRTLGYLLLDGKNYSPLVITARLAYGPSAKFGDNGLPQENAACLAAAKAAGPPPFEQPWLYRRRMRAVSEWMKKQGTYPHGAAPAAAPGK